MQGTADPPLDDLGRAQANAVALALAHETFDAIYSSPLMRARATAEAIAQPHRLGVKFDERLVERNLGEWTGLTGDEANARFPNRLDNKWWVEGPPGGEKQIDINNRISAVMSEILAHYANKTVAVISHGGTLNAYLSHLLNIPPEGHVVFRFDNTAIARLQFSSERIVLWSLGDVSHLKAIRNL